MGLVEIQEGVDEVVSGIELYFLGIKHFLDAQDEQSFTFCVLLGLVLPLSQHFYLLGEFVVLVVGQKLSRTLNAFD